MYMRGVHGGRLGVIPSLFCNVLDACRRKPMFNGRSVDNAQSQAGLRAGESVMMWPALESRNFILDTK